MRKEDDGFRQKLMSEIRIGISGWTYPPWRGVFYPKKWPQKRELEYASRQFSSIEINGTFYSLQTPKSYRTWYAATPAEFLFAIKGSRFITHLRRLKEIDVPLANFFASGVLELKEKLGPILWQFPPSFRFDEERLKAFFHLLPRDQAAAAKFAHRHDERVKSVHIPRIRGTLPIRHAIEVRHPSFASKALIRLLRECDIGMVVADTAGKWPLIEEVTSDFVYIRLHGDEQLYVSGYTDKALDAWAAKIRTWSHMSRWRKSRSKQASSGGNDIFVYFDNDVKVRAPFDAVALAHRLGVGIAHPGEPDFSTVTEEPRPGWPALKRQRRTHRTASIVTA
jgi:uncharacterized protein YecE (DUF72 family)